MKTAMTKFDEARVSFKHSLVLCQKLKGKKVEDAKQLLSNLIGKTFDIDGKYYTSASRKFLEMIGYAEANAKVKGFDAAKLFIKNAKADRGRTFMLPKSRFRHRGRKAKSTNIIIEVEER
jgi:ribosomal protein L22